MRRMLVAALVLLSVSLPAFAGGEVGEQAPSFDLKDSVNASLTTKNLDGRVIMVEVFRTW